MPQTVTTIVYAAFTELGVKPPDQPLSAAELSWGFDKLNRLIDDWATRRLFVYVIQHSTYAMPAAPLVVAAPQYWSIGPSGADITATRPVRIEECNLILNTPSPKTFLPIPVTNVEQFADLRVPTLTSTIPTRLYYQPTWPNGRLYFWPFPTQLSNSFQLYTWLQIQAFAATSDAFSFPPGYGNAIIWSLAESMLATYPTTASAEMIVEMAKRARYNIQSLNSAAAMPLLVTTDSGIPDGRQNYPSFDWRTGLTGPRGPR